MTFKDHFSKQAADYAKFRPGYPQELFAYLGRIAPSRELAWDCGTGKRTSGSRIGISVRSRDRDRCKRGTDLEGQAA